MTPIFSATKRRKGRKSFNRLSALMSKDGRFNVCKADRCHFSVFFAFFRG